MMTIKTQNFEAVTALYDDAWHIDQPAAMDEMESIHRQLFLLPEDVVVFG